jgi:hypothetical protein
MKPPSQAPSLGVPNNRPAWCAQFPLKPTVRFQLGSKSRSYARKLQPNPSRSRFYQLQYLFPKPFPQNQHH